MDSAKFVSDEETQVLWGNVLAGEFESPGSAPPSVIRVLSELTQEYATIFSSLCSLKIDYILDDGTELSPPDEYLCIDVTAPYLNALGITFAALKELECIGLITMSEAGYVNQFPSQEYPNIHLVSGPHILTVAYYPDKEFPTGYVTLTEAGSFISQFVPREHNQDHLLAVRSLLTSHRITFSNVPAIAATETTPNGSYSYSRI